MEGANIAPDSTSLPCPVHSSYPIMISGNQSHNIVSYQLILIAVDVIDSRHMQTDTCEERFPACHRMRSDYWMDRSEFEVLI
jgi:hypothetical protein